MGHFPIIKEALAFIGSLSFQLSSSMGSFMGNLPYQIFVVLAIKFLGFNDFVSRP